MHLKRWFRFGLALFVGLAMFCTPALAKVISPDSAFYYLDEAGILSQDVEGEIFFSNELLYEACGAQIVVVALNSTGNQAIGDYAFELFNDWGIGGEKENGFLLLLDIEGEDYYALCGTGLDSTFSAGMVKQYNDQYLEPDFAAGQYEAGVQKLFEAVFQRIADTYNANVTIEDGMTQYRRYLAEGGAPSALHASDHRSEEGGSSAMLIGVVIVLAIIFVFVLMSRNSRRRGSYSGGYASDSNHRRPVFIPIFPMRWHRPFRMHGFGFGPPPRGPRPPHAHAPRPPQGSGRSGSFGGSAFRGPSNRSGGGFGTARGGGGRTRGSGAGRGRH